MATRDTVLLGFGPEQSPDRAAGTRRIRRGAGAGITCAGRALYLIRPGGSDDTPPGVMSNTEVKATFWTPPGVLHSRKTTGGW
ncbi:hypothetical protein GCM10009735_14760 [Actinomadura chokoriensis]